MTDWVKRVLQSGKMALPDEIREALNKIEGMPGPPATSYMKKNGFIDLRDKKKRGGRQVWTHEEVDDLVFKVAVGGGNFQNTVEVDVWFDQKHPSFHKGVPSDTRDYLTPVLESDTHSMEDKWLIMPRADMDPIEEDEAVSLVRRMNETGWCVVDYGPDNMGWLDGELVFIDYGMLKPSRFMPDNWEENIRNRSWG